MTESSQARVWLRDEDPREGRELVFDFPFDEDLNEAVKRLPKRWFDWRRKHWRVPADPRVGKLVAGLLARFPEIDATPEVVAWLDESERWRAAVTVVAHEGAGAFLMRTLAGEPPPELAGATPAGEAKLLLPFDSPAARGLRRLEGVHLDDLAAACARELEEGHSPAPAELSLEIGDHGEPDVTLFTLWDPGYARDFRKLSEARLIHRPGRFFGRDGAWAVAVPGDPALAPALSEFIAERPDLLVEEPVAELLDELLAEHDRASRTVALSYAEDAELDDVELGGVLHPFQRAGVRYALERRRTFIADEQGLGKTVQALAALEHDDAFPAVVVCPASMKLMWER